MTLKVGHCSQLKKQVAHGHSEGVWEVHYTELSHSAFHEDQDATGVISMRTTHKVVLLKSLLEVNMDDMPVGCGKDK
jgi:hypothetical protein